MPSRTSNRAPGMDAAVRRPPLMSTRVSASPCMTRAGTPTSDSPWDRLPDASTAISWRPTPAGSKDRS